MSKIGIQIRGTSPILRQGLAQVGRAQPSQPKPRSRRRDSEHDRKKDLAALVTKAMIGGALASWLTATIAGILI